MLCFCSHSALFRVVVLERIFALLWWICSSRFGCGRSKWKLIIVGWNFFINLVVSSLNGRCFGLLVMFVGFMFSVA